MSDKTQTRQNRQPMMNSSAQDVSSPDFWRHHPDPTQAAVHLALQWLAFVYPASELQIDRTLKGALPYADSDLSARWSQFLDEKDVEDHVQALEWMADTLSAEQIPFMVETAWRLLLVDHELPTHVPLALRILGQILDIREDTIQRLGESVFNEYIDTDAEHRRAPLLPVDPRYLDRVEWRLYGHTATSRVHVPSYGTKTRSYTGLKIFLGGAFTGALVVVALVFGPLQLGRMTVPIMLHDGLLVEEGETAPEVIVTNPEISSPLVADNISEPTPEAPPVSEEPPETTTGKELESTAEVTAQEIAEETAEASATASQPESSSESTGQTERQLMAVTASILNVRASADVDGEILLKLAEGDRVWAYPDEAEGLWMQVRVEGLIGYASTRFLTPVE